MAFSDLLPAKRRKEELVRRGGDWNDMLSLRREMMERMFDDLFGGFRFTPFQGMAERLQQFSPSVDVTETDKVINVTAELPGMDEKDISVTLDDDTLLLCGERREERKDEKEEYFHREMSYGSFRRMIHLDAKIDTAKVEARFKKGVLKITLPKEPGSDSSRGKKIEIKS